MCTNSVTAPAHHDDRLIDRLDFPDGSGPASLAPSTDAGPRNACLEARDANTAKLFMVRPSNASTTT
jgi:hypothetical protein